MVKVSVSIQTQEMFMEINRILIRGEFLRRHVAGCVVIRKG